MGKKKKLKKKLAERGAEDSRCLVICIGKSCHPEEARELLRETRGYAEVNCPSVRVEAIGCLHVCKKGPVAATYPSIKFKKRVDLERARRLLHKLER